MSTVYNKPEEHKTTSLQMTYLENNQCTRDRLSVINMNRTVQYIANSFQVSDIDGMLLQYE